MQHLRPHFFIIGERKCGTSSLYRYLLTHPDVLPGRRKEMQFFTRGRDYVEKHFAEYLAQFPALGGTEDAVLDWPELDSSGALYEEPVRFSRDSGRRYVTGEASADTFCDVPPALLRRHLPDLKLILVLRDPTLRAYSHHRMLWRFQEEGREQPFRVGDFADDMKRELQMIERGQEAPCLSPGLYLGPLKRWVAEWGRSKLLVLFTRDLDDAKRRQALMTSVLRHLDLPTEHATDTGVQRYNQAPAAIMPDAARRKLNTFYRPHSEALEDYLGVPVPWLG